jgi:hypothetical protein
VLVRRISGRYTVDLATFAPRPATRTLKTQQSISSKLLFAVTVFQKQLCRTSAGECNGTSALVGINTPWKRHACFVLLITIAPVYSPPDCSFTTHPQLSMFPFLKLPMELRFNIYPLVAVSVKAEFCEYYRLCQSCRQVKYGIDQEGPKPLKLYIKDLCDHISGLQVSIVDPSPTRVHLSVTYDPALDTNPGYSSVPWQFTQIFCQHFDTISFSMSEEIPRAPVKLYFWLIRLMSDPSIDVKARSVKLDMSVLSVNLTSSCEG